MEWLKQQKADSWLIKGFLVFSLLLPVFYSPYTDVYQSAYYGGFSWAYLCLSGYMIVQLIRNRRKIKPSVPLFLYGGALFLYNGLSLYFNYRYLHWYWEQINNTAAFLLFLVLVICEVRLDGGKQDHIRFFIHCIILSNVASIVCYLLGYTKLMLCNQKLVLYEFPLSFYEVRHYWIYSHKSEYALMLVAFTALFVAYREKFKNRVTFGLSLALLLVCLYFTHSWTGAAGVVLIFMGSFLDRIRRKGLHIKKGYVIGGGFLVLAAAVVGFRILAERDLMTLGGRLEIWPAALEVIRKHPEGWGMSFGESAIATASGAYVNNAHNLFLNAMLRFSVPVGICFTLLFLGIAVYSLIKSRTFLAAGMWAALLILLNMDYALMSLQMAPLFLVVYLVCFRAQKKDEK